VFFDKGYYTAYNEPDLQAPFLFIYSGAPWKTQETVRGLLGKVYSDQPNGIPGNDDCGTMSSWYLFSAMGFYPQDPARPEFVLCSPLFPRVTLHLPDRWKSRDFTIEATHNENGNAYIQSVTLNGKPWSAPWFRLSELTGGKYLTVALGPEPNKTWGTAEDVRPPSITK
jgi:putative alpha-1,2-mannosidase